MRKRRSGLNNNTKMIRISRGLLIALASLVGIVIIVFVAAKILVNVGRSRLYKINGATSVPTLTIEASEIDEEENKQNEEIKQHVWKDGWIRYNGEIYEYNENILTFLVLGIDKEGTVKVAKNATDGGQSDAIFLVVTNPDDKSIKVLAVDRNTMTDVLMKGIGANGADVIERAQICLQHGFGDGGKESCELTRDAVSKLMYDLPIHAYMSVNYGAMKTITDAVGGVEVTITEDILFYNKNWVAGEERTLYGDDAVAFIKRRDIKVPESARLRTLRQKQYLSSLSKKVYEKSKENVTFPLTVYTSIKDYTVTDLTIDEISYLATELAGYSFSPDDIYTMSGETELINGYEAFSPDEEALKNQMIQLFYRVVDESEYK